MRITLKEILYLAVIASLCFFGAHALLGELLLTNFFL